MGELSLAAGMYWEVFMYGNNMALIHATVIKTLTLKICQHIELCGNLKISRATYYKRLIDLMRFFHDNQTRPNSRNSPKTDSCC